MIVCGFDDAYFFNSHLPIFAGTDLELARYIVEV
jgi:hypothetical protein